MRERPILFSAPMIRAIQSGTKTQTRRVVKVQSDEHGYRVSGDSDGEWLVHGGGRVRCPYGSPGTRLWVRETWTWNGGRVDCQRPRSSPMEYHDLYVTYAADGVRRTIQPGGVVPVPKQPPQRPGEVYCLRDAPIGFAYDGENTYYDRLTRWWNRKIPAIHMPRWASRITLELTDVRVERLLEISEEDAMAEGIKHSTLNDPRVEFQWLWDSINAKRAPWAGNPWVWVLCFRRIEQTADQEGGR